MTSPVMMKEIINTEITQMMIKEIKIILYALILLSVTSCAQYEVVQKLDVNMYHLQNVRTKDVQVILSSDKLVEGSFVKLNKIRIIAEIEK